MTAQCLLTPQYASRSNHAFLIRAIFTTFTTPFVKSATRPIPNSRIYKPKSTTLLVNNVSWQQFEKTIPSATMIATHEAMVFSQPQKPNLHSPQWGKHQPTHNIKTMKKRRFMKPCTRSEHVVLPDKDKHIPDTMNIHPTKITPIATPPVFYTLDTPEVANAPTQCVKILITVTTSVPCRDSKTMLTNCLSLNASPDNKNQAAIQNQTVVGQIH